MPVQFKWNIGTFIWVAKKHLYSRTSTSHRPTALLSGSWSHMTFLYSATRAREGDRPLPGFGVGKQNSAPHRAPHTAPHGAMPTGLPFIMVPKLTFALGRDPGASFSSLSFCLPSKTVAWTGGFMSTLFMARKAYKSNFQNRSCVVNTDGRDTDMVDRKILLKVLRFSP